MTDLSNLNRRSILEMDSNEALNTVLAIREARRKPQPKKSTSTKRKSTRKQSVPELNSDQAERLLALLTK